MPKTGAQILALTGELGAGKTTFTRGFARGLGVVGRIVSPTFVIARRYETKTAHVFWHIDAYRLHGPEDMTSIDWEEITADTNNVIVLEWADRVADAVPATAKWFAFAHHEQGRDVTETGYGKR
jgi:tRNA threonylcarbamoyladenosine biosynthesis protein TsaE